MFRVGSLYSLRIRGTMQVPLFFVCFTGVHCRYEDAAVLLSGWPMRGPDGLSDKPHANP